MTKPYTPQLKDVYGFDEKVEPFSPLCSRGSLRPPLGFSESHRSRQLEFGKFLASKKNILFILQVPSI